MVVVVAARSVAAVRRGLGDAAWLDCAANRRIPPRPGNAREPHPRGAGAHRQHHRAQRGAGALLRAAGRGAARPARARGLAAAAGGRRPVAAIGLEPRLRAALHPPARTGDPPRQGRALLRGRPRFLAQQRQRRARRGLVLQPEGIRDPRRQHPLDRRTARRPRAGPARGRFRRAQRCAPPRDAPRRVPAAGVGRALQPERRVPPAAAHGQRACGSTFPWGSNWNAARGGCAPGPTWNAGRSWAGRRMSCSPR
jgi:hypothetical protein